MSETSERTIFADALEQAPDSRSAYLDGICGIDTPLRRRIDALLGSHEKTGSFMNRPAADPRMPSAVCPSDDDLQETAFSGSDPKGALAWIKDAPVEFLPKFEGYKITGRLGAGGMGVVWRAMQEGTQRPVALKLMGAAGFGSGKARLRFRREVELTANLEHPNIARVYEGGERHGICYYAMELIDGVPLDQYVKDNRMSSRDTLALMATVCRAVQHAHEKGVIHRDLKPANILVDNAGQPHVLDFGLAKALAHDAADAISLDGELAGTPVYMSPEQANGQLDKLDTRSDVYTLGVILFHLQSGKFPHDTSGSALEVIQRIATLEPKQLQSVDPRADRELQAILSKALSKEPQRRYGTAGGLGADLERYLAGDPLEARPPTLGYLIQKKARRHRVALAVAAVIAATLLGTAIAAYVRINIERNAAVNANIEKEQQRLEANRQRLYAERQTSLAKESERRALAGEKRAEEQRKAAELSRADGLVAQGNALGMAGRWSDAKLAYNQAYDGYQQLKVSTLPADAGSAKASAESPPPLLTFKGLDKWIYCVAASPHGRTALSGGFDPNLTLWDVATGCPLLSFAGHTARVFCIDISRDGRLALSGGEDKTVRLWDMQTGRQMHVFTGHGEYVSCVQFSPDGRTAVSGSEDGSLKIWDVQNFTEIRTFARHPEKVLCLNLSADGRTVLTGCRDGRVRLWRIEDGALIGAFLGLNGSIRQITFIANDRQVLGGSNTGEICQWDLAGGKEIRRFPKHGGPIRGIIPLPGGKAFVSCSEDKTIKVWDTASGNETTTLSGHASLVTGICPLPDGHRIVSCSQDYTLRVWDLQPSRELHTLAGPATDVKSLAVSPDGRMALGASSDAIRLWDLPTGQLIRTLAGPAGQVDAVAFSPDGAVALSNIDTSVILWDLIAGKPIHVMKGHQALVRAVAISPDGTRGLSASNDKTLKLWNLADGMELRTLKGHRDSVAAVAFSPDGRMAASGAHNNDKTVKLWDLETNREIRPLPGHEGTVYSVAFFPDGKRLLVGSGDQQIRLWDIQTATKVRTLDGHSAEVRSVATSSDGRFALSGSIDRTMKLWDADSGKELQSYGHSARVNCVASGAIGRIALCGMSDGQIEAWDWNRPSLDRDFEITLTGALKTLRRDKTDSSALAVLGNWYAFRGVDDWAVEMLERARASGVTVSPLVLGRCYWKMRNISRAKSEFQTALDFSHDAREQTYLRLCMVAMVESR